VKICERSRSDQVFSLERVEWCTRESAGAELECTVHELKDVLRSAN
jgi:hypothetical protein